MVGAICALSLLSLLVLLWLQCLVFHRGWLDIAERRIGIYGSVLNCCCVRVGTGVVGCNHVVQGDYGLDGEWRVHVLPGVCRVEWLHRGQSDVYTVYL